MTARQPPRRELSLLDLLEVLWRRKLLIISVMVLGVGLTLGAVSLLPRTYLARALVLIDPATGRGPASAVGAPSLSLDPAVIDSQVQIIGSRLLARQVVADLALQDDPELMGFEAGTAARLGRLVPWLGSEPAAPDQGEPTAETAAPSAERDPDVARIDRFLARLAVQREGKTHVIGVAYSSADPDKAARIANAVAEHYLLAQLEAKHEAARRAGAWLNERLIAARADLDRAQASMERLGGAPVAVTSREAGSEIEQLAQLNRQLVDAMVDRTAKDAKLQRIKDMIRRGEQPGPVDEVGSAVLLQNLHALKAQALRREAELSAQYGDRHPRLIDARRETTELGTRIEAEQAALIREFEGLVRVARGKEETIARELERVKQHAAARDRQDVQLKSAEQEVELARRIYATYLQEAERVADPDALQEPDARIISEAVPPAEPLFPKPKLTLSVSLTVSLVVALVAVYLAELAERGFRTGGDVEAELGIPCLGLVPRGGAKQGSSTPQDYLVDRPQSRLAEALRGVLATLLAGREPGEGRIVLVTSAMPGEGKTTLTLGLGRLAALEGLSVLVIDADFRRPAVHEIFGPKARAGMAEVLKGELSFEEALAQDPRTRLKILPGSRRLDQPTRLLGNEGVGRLLATAKARFDLVLVDSAPLLAVADARLLAPQADRVVVAIRWHATARAVASHCLAELRASGAPVTGAVLNLVDIRRHAHYGHKEAAFANARLVAYYTD